MSSATASAAGAAATTAALFGLGADKAASAPTSPLAGRSGAGGDGAAGFSLPELAAEKARLGGACAGWSPPPGTSGSAWGRPSVDQLLGDLSATRLALRVAEAQAATADKEAERLSSQVVQLEGDKRALRVEVERWRRKCASLEQANTSLANLLDEAQLNLKEAIGREKDLGRAAVERQLLTTEAENKTILARVKVEEVRLEACAVQRALDAKSAEADALTKELGELREQREKQRVRDELEAQSHRGPSSPRALEASQVGGIGTQQVGKLEAQIHDFRCELHNAAAREAALQAEVDVQRTERLKAEAVNRRLRLDLQEVMAQAIRYGERPYYYGASGLAVDPDGSFAAVAAGIARDAGDADTAREGAGRARDGGGGGAGGSPRRGKAAVTIVDGAARPSSRSPKCRPPLRPLLPSDAGNCGCSILDAREKGLDAIDRLFEAPTA